MLLLCFIVVNGHLLKGQSKDTLLITASKILYQNNLAKAKSNRTTGWILFGVGTGSMIGGFVSALSSGLIFSTNPNKGKGLFIAGAATSLASIPFFIAGGIHKHKAKLALQRESVYIGSKVISQYDYTSLSLSMQLFNRKNKR